MDRIPVRIPRKDSSYEIILGSGALSSLREILDREYKNHAVIVVTDDTVHRLQGMRFRDAISPRNAETLIIPAGERSKTRDTKARLEDDLLRRGCGRDTLIIAVGGGVVGDLAGFVAGTYNRGIPFIQVPTTLLAMVDASMGGKTGVNTSRGKNLIGCFHQPQAVVADLDVLGTLPQDEWVNGIAEIIKMAAILDRTLFSTMETTVKEILDRKDDVMGEIIARAISLKRDVVEKDEEEAGYRQCLNFGHTIAHAIEAQSSFTMGHGQAVAIGMAVEASIAHELGYLDEKEVSRLHTLLDGIGLPTTLPPARDHDGLMQAMRGDKKSLRGNVHLVLLDRLGVLQQTGGKWSFPVEEQLIRNILRRHTR